MEHLINRIFAINDPALFEELALEVFRFQAERCLVYQKYIGFLGIRPEQVNQLDQIPYLPIEFFKSQEVVSDSRKPEIVFSSSGTTGMTQSRHLVTRLNVYEQSFKRAFEQFYGSPKDVCILALLPSYLERDGSSLIYMVDALMDESKNADSGYFLHDHEDLYLKLMKLQAVKQKTILIGVTYALLDFVEKYHIDFPELIVMETGGMKGKRKEMVRAELHEQLQKGFGITTIHSEYGMTELLSQGYSKGAGIFNCPPWMRISLRDTNDPLSSAGKGKTGGINVIDLANINSCSFLATQDLGLVFQDGSFEVLGRFDNADIRGCNLLVN